MTRYLSIAKAALASSLLLSLIQAHAQPAYPLGDLNRESSTSSSLPYEDRPWVNLVTARGKGFFFAYHPLHGTELWITDGTPQGTRMVRELQPGVGTELPPQGTGNYQLVAAGETVYFAGSDPQFGTELFKSDGTEAGTVPVMDLIPGLTGANPQVLATNGNTLFFSARTISSRGSELWKTDGSPAGTLRLYEPAPELDGLARRDDGVSPASFVPAGVLNGVLYYPSHTAAVGTELWRSDGSPAGTFLLKDLDPRQGSDGNPRDSFPDGFIKAGNLLYFTATTEDGYELWRTDGTATGTFRLQDFSQGSLEGQPSIPTSSFQNGELYAAALGDLLLFNPRFREGADESTPIVPTLFLTDGTEAGTKLLAPDITIESRPIVAAGKAWFLGTGLISRDPDTYATGIWVADTRSARFIRASPGPLAVVGNLLFHRVDHDALQSSSLETIDTQSELANPPALEWSNVNGYRPTAGFSPLGNQLFFSFDDGIHGSEPWISDGSPSGTKPLLDINASTGGSLNFNRPASNFIVNAGEEFYFRTESHDPNNPILDQSLWVSDGTQLGTTRIPTSLYPVDQSGNVWGAYYDNALFCTMAEIVDFRPRNGEVHRVSNTRSTLLKEIFSITSLEQPVNPGSWPDSFFKAGSYLYFRVYDPEFLEDSSKLLSATTEEYVQLWRTDGTESGTVYLKGFAPGPQYSLGPVRFFDLNGTLLFLSVLDNPDSFQWWTSDGTASGTKLLLSTALPIRAPKQVGAKVFYFLDKTLWVTDGTLQGTHQVADIGPWPGFSPGNERFEDNPMVAYQDRLFFDGQGIGSSNSGIFSSDGTSAGTKLEIPGIRTARNFSVAGGFLYFTTDGNGPEPWNPNQPAFSSLLSTCEIWRTDGTLAGTKQIYNEPFDRDDPSSIMQMIAVDDVLLLIKRDTTHGLELWRSDGTREGTTLLQDIHPGPSSAFESPVLSLNGITRNHFIFPALTERGIEPWSLPRQSLHVAAPTLVVGSTNITASVGQALSIPISQVSGAPATFAAHNLPPGLRIDPQSGLLSGTPTFRGKYRVTVDAKNSGATRSLKLTLDIRDLPITRIKATWDSVNSLRLSFEGNPASTYVLETSPNLLNWEPLRENVTTTTQITLQASELSAPQRFFRLRSK